MRPAFLLTHNFPCFQLALFDAPNFLLSPFCFPLFFARLDVCFKVFVSASNSYTIIYFHNQHDNELVEVRDVLVGRLQTAGLDGRIDVAADGAAELAQHGDCALHLDDELGQSQAAARATAPAQTAPTARG